MCRRVDDERCVVLLVIVIHGGVGIVEEKSMLGNNSVCDPRRERIIIKLQERRQLLSLVKTARLAAEVTRRKVGFEVPATSLVQAKLYQNDDSIVSVMRTGEWVEAIPLKKKNSCVQTNELCQCNKASNSLGYMK